MSKRKTEVKCRVEVTEWYKEILIEASKAFGGRNIEREAGLWTGMISSMLSGKQKTISAETDAAISSAIARLEEKALNVQGTEQAEAAGSDDDDQTSDEEINAILDEVRYRAKLFGRISAAQDLSARSAVWMTASSAPSALSRKRQSSCKNRLGDADHADGIE